MWFSASRVPSCAPGARAPWTLAQSHRRPCPGQSPAASLQSQVAAGQAEWTETELGVGAGKGASGQIQSTLWLALETSLTTAEIQLILQFFRRQQPQPRRRAGGAQQGGAG